MFKLCLLVVAALTLGPQAVKAKIVGGVDADLGQIPYHALLKKAGIYFCSGALISQTHVMSSGYCVEMYKLTDGLTAVVGTIDLNRGGQSYGIMEKVSHQSLPSFYAICDIGIFRLFHAVTLSEFVKIGNLKLPGKEPPYSNVVVSAAGSRTLNEPYLPHIQMLTDIWASIDIFQSNVRSREQFCSGNIGGPVASGNDILGVAIGCNNFPDRPNTPISTTYTSVYRCHRWISELRARI